MQGQMVLAASFNESNMPTDFTDFNKKYEYGIGYIDGTFWINNLTKDSLIRVEGEKGYFMVSIVLNNREVKVGEIYTLSIKELIVVSYTPYAITP